MLETIKKAVFSLSGLAITLGVLGFLSGIVELFIETDSTLSVKWLLLTILLALSLVFILMKIIYDLHCSKETQSSFASPIRILESGSLLIIRRNDNFVSNIIVSCYYINDGIERFAYVGFVLHVQEKLVQIRILRNFLSDEHSLNNPPNVTNLIIRPVLPSSVLQALVQGERP